MKVRVRSCLLVWLVCFALPIAFGAAGLSGGPIGIRSAMAQQPDAVTALARERFLEGVDAYDRRQYEAARSLFLQAYALKRHPAVLLNLGQSEIKAGHIAEGGNHLQQFLREHKAATEEQKQAAKKGIAEARARAAHVVVIVDIDGAQVSLDGAPIGQSPLLDPIFVIPGQHTASATMSGKTVTAQVAAKRGTATPVSLSLAAVGVAPVPAPVPTTPEPAPTSTAPPPPTSTYTPPPPPAPAAPTPPPPPPEPRADQGRENFFHWYRRKPVAWVLTGVAGLGLIGTIGFGAAAATADSSADDVSDAILVEVDRWKDDPSSSGHLPDGYYDNGDPTTGTPQPCGDFDDPTTAYPHYSNACDTLRDNINARDTDLAVMTVSIVLMAASVGGTVIYYFVDTNDGDAPASVEGGASVTAGPIITPTMQGLGVIGTF